MNGTLQKIPYGIVPYGTGTIVQTKDSIFDSVLYFHDCQPQKYYY